MRRGGVAGLALLLLAAAPATAQPEAHGQAEAPIVTAGGSLTEIVYALGAGARIVGVDATSSYPPAAAALPQIGYYRQLAAEGILSLGPGLLLASADAGPPATFDQLEGAGVAVTIVPEEPTAAGITDKIRLVGATIGLEAEAAAMADAVAADFAAVGAAVAAAVAAEDGTRPAIMFTIGFSNGAPLVAGSGSAADAILALAGADNPFHAIDGYKPASLEAIAAAAPDWVIVAAHAADAMGGIEAVAAQPALATTPAARDGRIIEMDTLYLLGLGPRTPFAIRDLAALIHPTWQDPGLPERPWMAATAAEGAHAGAEPAP